LRRLPQLLPVICLLLTDPVVAGEAELRAFAGALGLEDQAGFAATVTRLCREGRLPEACLTRREAERLGWRPGADLCQIAPGKALGGDRFGNRERHLPERPGRGWYEADLDFACGRRGAPRLVFSSDGRIYVTVDHYETFEEVPP
jgi:hypothetical protein